MISKFYTHVSTANELAELPADGNRYELIEGQLHMMSPAGNEHGNIAMVIGAELFQHVRSNELGKVYAAETGFLIGKNPDTIRAPDAAFVSNDQLRIADPTQTYLALAPDIAVEVVSPSDVFVDVEAKATQWMDAGTKVVLVANPKDETLRVYSSRNEIQVLRQDRFDAGAACEGWTLAVADVFR